MMLSFNVFLLLALSILINNQTMNLLQYPYKDGMGIGTGIEVSTG